MQLVKPSIKHLDVTSDPLKAIEAAGRTCYKSEDKITDDSAERFVKMLLDRRHHAMIEHGNFILSVDGILYEEILKVEDRQFIRMSCDVGGNGCLVSGNPRALRDFCLRPDVSSRIQRSLAVELSKHTPLLFDDTIRYTDHLSQFDITDFGVVELFENIDSLSISEKLKHQVASYRVVSNRGFTHEQVRHRPFSYAQESTRFCNYKGGVSFIIPAWITLSEGKISLGNESTPASPFLLEGEEIHQGIITNLWIRTMYTAQQAYTKLVKHHNQKPQQARGVLPIDLKTEIVVTGNLQQWMIFFKLRCTPARAPKEDLIDGIWYHATAPHPQMQEVANMVLADMKTRVPVIFDDMG
jgi:thymidylate synthase (FAD)